MYSLQIVQIVYRVQFHKYSTSVIFQLVSLLAAFCVQYFFEVKDIFEV